MLGDFIPEPQGPSAGLRMSGKVILTASDMNAKAAAKRPSTLRLSSGEPKLGMSGEKKKPKPMSKRAHAARLAAQKREDAVVAAQRPQLDRMGFNSYLRTGAL